MLRTLDSDFCRDFIQLTAVKASLTAAIQFSSKRKGEGAPRAALRLFSLFDIEHRYFLQYPHYKSVSVLYCKQYYD